ncbi:MAG: SUMF1/EgtB/PvdO family nonheme iron enzyme [Pseudomonadota bacterium]
MTATYAAPPLAMGRRLYVGLAKRSRQLAQVLLLSAYAGVPFAHDGYGAHGAPAVRASPGAGAKIATFPRPPERPAGIPRVGGRRVSPSSATTSRPDPEGFVWLPAGRVWLGGAGYGRYNPPREMSFPGLWVARFEVSVSDYAACAAAGACARPAAARYCNRLAGGAGSLPVNCVSAEDATAYAAYVSARDSLHYRLPTCEEWERAARAGLATRFPWGDAWPGARCNGCDAGCPESWHDTSVDDGFSLTAPVSALPHCGAEGGAQQMIGNVAEWCRGGLAGAPWDVRGGSWRHLRAFQDPAMPRRFDGAERSPDAGFRLVVDRPAGPLRP